jgi:hypothetical protein
VKKVIIAILMVLILSVVANAADMSSFKYPRSWGKPIDFDWFVGSWASYHVAVTFSKGWLVWYPTTSSGLIKRKPYRIYRLKPMDISTRMYSRVGW